MPAAHDQSSVVLAALPVAAQPLREELRVDLDLSQDLWTPRRDPREHLIVGHGVVLAREGAGVVVVIREGEGDALPEPILEVEGERVWKRPRRPLAIDTVDGEPADDFGEAGLLGRTRRGVQVLAARVGAPQEVEARLDAVQRLHRARQEVVPARSLARVGRGRREPGLSCDVPAIFDPSERSVPIKELPPDVSLQFGLLRDGRGVGDVEAVCRARPHPHAVEQGEVFGQGIELLDEQCICWQAELRTLRSQASERSVRVLTARGVLQREALHVEWRRRSFVPATLHQLEPGTPS